MRGMIRSDVGVGFRMASTHDEERTAQSPFNNASPAEMEGTNPCTADRGLQGGRSDGVGDVYDGRGPTANGELAVIADCWTRPLLGPERAQNASW